MEAMGQYMHLRLAPGDKLAVEPDPTIAIVEGNERHGESSSFQGSLLTNPLIRDVKQNGASA
ncbi:hypothetical protein GALL_512510 [mine drainage metagenome]|uniref:Uncharacterized protein n=1 Tax=mine drainage metagenome TaxID=410659 RepID=A0A1J5PI10_9ZZZZ